MRFSLFKRRISIETATETADAMGGASTAWAALATVWADRRNKGSNRASREGVEADMIVGTDNPLFTIRYSTDVSALDSSARIKDGTEYFGIVSVTPVPGNKPTKLEIQTERRAA